MRSFYIHKLYLNQRLWQCQIEDHNTYIIVAVTVALR